MPRKGQVIPPENRFWKLVDVAGPTDCWLWRGSTNHKGYGMFKWDPNKNPIGSHRASWLIANGKIPGKLHVLHNCHVRACVNPSHLRLGTNADNMADKVAIGNTPRGESSGRAKLTRWQVSEIRRLYATGRYTQVKLGNLYNISRTNIGYIVRNNSWKHIR